jgi:hypothetical protein
MMARNELARNHQRRLTESIDLINVGTSVKQQGGKLAVAILGCVVKRSIAGAGAGAGIRNVWIYVLRET